MSPNIHARHESQLTIARSILDELLDLDGLALQMTLAPVGECREQGEREASPTAAIIDSQSVKSAEKGGPASIHLAMMRARRSKARSAIFS